MKRLLLIGTMVLMAALMQSSVAQAHYAGYSNQRNWLFDTNIAGWCGKSDAWVCTDKSSWVVVGDSWDNDGSSKEGYHSREWYSRWKEYRWVSVGLDTRWCEMWYRMYHYEFAERYRGPNCWG